MPQNRLQVIINEHNNKDEEGVALSFMLDLLRSIKSENVKQLRRSMYLTKECKYLIGKMINKTIN